MRKKVNSKGVILKTALFATAVVLVALTFHSCQKDDEVLNAGEISGADEIDIKSGMLSEITLDFPTGDVTAGEDFEITYSSTCGRIMIEHGFIEEVDGDTGEILKVYSGLDCDSENLVWEEIEVGGFANCQGGSITENLTEPGTYVYRAKLNFKARRNSGCDDCDTFTGNLFECFMITVVEASSPNSFTDARDGKVYQTVTIGTQTWMAENLAYKTTSGSYAYNDDESNVATYGRLYTWSAASTACPAGWHLPTNPEWNTMITYLYHNGYGYSGNMYQVAKALASTTGWWVNTVPGTVGNDQQSNNSSGFNAFPGGRRAPSGIFWEMGRYAYWWTATHGYDSHYNIKSINYNDAHVLSGWRYTDDALIVRCVKTEN